MAEPRNSIEKTLAEIKAQMKEMAQMQAEVVKQISQEREHSHKREEQINTAGRVGRVGVKTSRWEDYQVWSQIWEVDACTYR